MPNMDAWDFDDSIPKPRECSCTWAVCGCSDSKPSQRDSRDIPENWTSPSDDPHNRNRE